jgi:heme oxygenase
LVDYLRFYKLSDTKDRIAFKEKYRRSYINKEMATSILNYL